MIIRRFTSHGIEEFRRQLIELKLQTRTNFDRTFLDQNEYAIEESLNLEVEQLPFSDKYSISKYLVEKLDLHNNRHFYYDVGLWTWLSAYYFDLICPPQANKGYNVRAEARYILADPKNWVRYYRHLLACPARLLTELGELANPFLASPIHIWGDFHEQLTAYQGIATNKSLIGAAYLLYWDEQQKKLKRGAGSKGQGSPRRFSDIVGQFELTYDLNAMESSAIKELLPLHEFSRWVSRS